MKLNITQSTMWFTIIQGILGVSSSTLQDRYPEVSFWCGYGVAVTGVILLNIKQFGTKKQEVHQDE